MKGFLHRGVCARGAAFRHLGACSVVVRIRYHQGDEGLFLWERIHGQGEEMYTPFLRKRRRSLRKAYTREGLESGIWEASVDVYIYAFIKIMKSFLRRSVYVGRARKCVRYFRERAEEVSEKRIREKEPEIRHFGAYSLMACIRFFQDDEGVPAQ